MELIFLTINTQVDYFQAFNIFTIDNSKPLSIEVKVEENNSNDVHKFIQNIYSSFNHIKTKRSCTFPLDSNPYVAGNLKEIIKLRVELNSSNTENNDVEENEMVFQEALKNHSKNIADKLLNVQKGYISNNNGASKNPSDGSLIVIFTELKDSPNKFNFIISKINLELYLDKEESRYRAGLPEKNSIQKSCFIEASYDVESENVTFHEIQIADSNMKIADFWMTSFLELIPANNDTNNTMNAFTSIKSTINRKLRSSSIDRIRLENNLIGYFENNQNFNSEEAIDAIVGDKNFKKNLGISVKEFKDTLRNLPRDKNFDSSFEIQEASIQNQFKKTIPLTSSMDLRTKSHIEDLENKIFSQEDGEGGYELVIKNIDIQTFENFKKEE